MAQRYDSSPLGNLQRTPTGGVRIPAVLSRVGVFTYRNADGSARREYRPPDEVFHKDSIASLQDAAVTEHHPGEPVSSGNYSKLAKGHVSGANRADTGIGGSVVITDETTIKRIDAKEFRDLSPGYSVDLDPTPGVTPEGERYDAVQRNIRYNHVALLPPGNGRQGSEVSLRLDAGDAEQVLVSERKDNQMKETINGIEYTVGSPEHLQALRKDREDQRARADAAEAKIKEATEARDKAAGERDALKTRADAAEAKAKEGEDPKRLDTLVAERTAVVTVAKSRLGKDADFSGKTNLEIMTEVCRKDNKDFPAEASEAYVKGAFAMLQTASRDMASESHRADQQNPNTPATRETRDDEKSARAEQNKRNSEAWKKPLRSSLQGGN